MNRKFAKQFFLFILVAGLSFFAFQTRSTPFTFNIDSGFYPNNQLLEITPPHDTDVIYYTLDGTAPSATNGLRYTGPIQLTPSLSTSAYYAREDFSLLPQYKPNSVDKEIIVKAVAIDASGKASDVISKVYFIDTDSSPLSEKYAGIPILSIFGEPDDLFGYEDGILITGKDTDEWIESYTDDEGLNFDEHLATLSEDEKDNFLIDYHICANFNRKGEESERKVQLDCFNNKALLFSQLAGLRKRGKFSSVGSQKGFNLYFREEYGERQCSTDLFSSGIAPSRCSLKKPSAIYADAFISDLVADRRLIPLYHTPVSVFLQGEYWGTYCLYEHWDKKFFKKHYGYEEVSIIKNGHSTDNDAETEEAFYNLIRYVSENNMSLAENYDYISDHIDMQSLIDHYCTRIIVDDVDSEEQYNMLAWKNNCNMQDESEKWHWALYDIDASFTDYTRNNTDKEIRSGRRGFLQHDLISGLLKNQNFKKQFAITFCDMINFNFSYERAQEQFSKSVVAIKPYLYYSQERFSGSSSVDSRINHISKFLQLRPAYIMKYIQNALKLDAPEHMYLYCPNDSDHGIPVDVNTSKVNLDNNGYALQYFPNYTIHLAVSNNYWGSFTQWEAKHADGKVDVYPSKSIDLIPEEGLEITLIP